MKILSLLVLFLAFPCSIIMGAPAGSTRMTPVVRAVAQAAPAVVNITSSRLVQGTPLERFFGHGFDPFGNVPGRVQKRASLGSGVIVDGKNGLVLTNAHVIAGGDEIMVHLRDGREFKARIRGVDPDFDIAALEIEGKPQLPAVPLGDSSDLMPGETVIAIGNPFGFAHTVTTGVVSALNRSIRHGTGSMLTELIQTDAAINPGNSGGPLLNIEGALIGINTAIDTRGEGIGFAIPINKAKHVMEGLVANGKVEPLWFGILAENVDQPMARALGLSDTSGALVTKVYPGTPADKNAIRPGDVIRSLNGAQLRDKRDYVNALRNQTPDTPVKVQIVRDGKPLTITMTPAQFDRQTARKLLESRWGFTVTERNGRVVVANTTPRGPATFLRKEDTVRSIGQRSIRNMADLLAAFHAERMSGQIALLIERNGRNYYGRLIP